MKKINGVYNVPDYAMEYGYWVATRDDDDLWFYGAYKDEDKAYEIAGNIDGQVVYNR